ncbi:hypothetical protein AB1E18_011602 [Capra hircus]
MHFAPKSPPATPEHKLRTVRLPSTVPAAERDVPGKLRMGRAGCLAPSALEEAPGGGPAGGAALPAVTSPGAEGRQTGSSPSPPPPGAGSVGVGEMLQPPAVGVAERAAAGPPAPPPP